MKVTTPVYFAVGTALCLYLAMASRNGWSLGQSVTPRAVTPAGRSLQHK